MKRHWLDTHIRNIPDFPKKGIQFKDITPVLLEPGAIKKATKELVETVQGVGGLKVDLVAGIEARGFLLAPMIATELGVGVILVRKEGKLPGETFRVEYELEYGTATLEVHKDQILQGAKVFVVDDLLATGGTAKATTELLELAGAETVALGFLVELVNLGARNKLISTTKNIYSLVAYD